MGEHVASVVGFGDGCAGEEVHGHGEGGEELHVEGVVGALVFKMGVWFWCVFEGGGALVDGGFEKGCGHVLYTAQEEQEFDIKVVLKFLVDSFENFMMFFWYVP